MSRLTVDQGNWAALGQLASEIRRLVFIEEQNVPKHEEWDGRDDDSLHFLAWHDQEAMGTARLLPDGHIGRVAVLPHGRGLGIGQALMHAAIDAAGKAGHPRVELAAQTHALAFYQRLGFEPFGSEFVDAGIPHFHMRLPLSD
ncbi:GNAT family N-acetyltransferase [Aidingimonas lacisalsi]|uniref:GNAT family N-acetyltransferase n=1 Tax=Aidingimonas lacisalsi TaxID=2604086 RepID=UPI0011D25DD5|nr:GNAT family N-acetyltransferase [Aidingimonas lacisalsi]